MPPVKAATAQGAPTKAPGLIRRKSNDLFAAMSPAGFGGTHRRLDEAIAREELAGLAYMFWGRLIALGMIAIWVALTLPLERSGVYLAAIAAFALLGAPPYLLALRGLGSHAVTAAFLLLDAAILSYILVVPTPYDLEGWTQQLNLRLPNFLYLGVFLVGMPELEAAIDASGAVAVEMAPGCDLRRDTCNLKFGNLLNFGGFPDIPGRNPFGGSSIV